MLIKLGEANMIVVTGDTHLAPRAWASIPGVSGDSYNSFNQIVEYCLRHKASGLVLAGDVFDAQPPPETVRVFLGGVERLKLAGIHVLAIQGQHGRDRTLPWTSIDPWVRHIHGQVIVLDGVRIVGLDNMPPDELKAALSGLPPADVLILHQLAKGTVGDREGRQGWDFDPEDVPAFVKVVCLGDYHAAWHKKLDRSGFVTQLYYTGSICMQSIDEPPDKSFLRLNTVDSHVTSVERVPLRTRPFQQFTLITEEQVINALEASKALEPETMVHVKFDSRLVDVEARFTAIRPDVHFYCRLLPVEVIDPNATARFEPGTQVSLEGCLELMVKRETAPLLYSFLLNLLKSKNHRDSLENYKARFFADQGETRVRTL